MKLQTLRNVALALVLAVPTLVLAQATRTWVSGVGDDANPCSRTAPCKTFAGAISKTAPAGEINVLDPGGFGAVTITKAITISSENFEAGVLVSGTNGIVISAGPNDVVVLRGLDIQGLNTGLDGVKFLNGGALHIERSVINQFTGQGINFAPSTNNASLFVTDTIIRKNAGGGIWVVPAAGVTAKVVVRNTQMDFNFRGLRAEDGSTVSINDSSTSNNTQNGIVAFGNGNRAVDMTIERTVTNMNGSVGVYAGTSCNVRISNITATRNATGLMVSGGNIVSFGNNSIAGNTTADGAPSVSVGRI